MTIIPYRIFGWDGRVPLKSIFIVSWILLMVANSLLINTYRILYTQYAKVEQPIDLGDPKNYITKDRLKITMICNTILLWILLIYSEYVGEKSQTKPSQYVSMIYKGFEINNQMVFLSAISITFSCLNIYLSDKLSKNTNKISTPFNFDYYKKEKEDKKR
jgi:hypothetical protein